MRRSFSLASAPRGREGKKSQGLAAPLPKTKPPHLVSPFSIFDPHPRFMKPSHRVLQVLRAQRMCRPQASIAWIDPYLIHSPARRSPLRAIRPHPRANAAELNNKCRMLWSFRLQSRTDILAFTVAIGKQRLFRFHTAPLLAPNCEQPASIYSKPANASSKVPATYDAKGVAAYREHEVTTRQSHSTVGELGDPNEAFQWVRASFGCSENAFLHLAPDSWRASRPLSPNAVPITSLVPSTSHLAARAFSPPKGETRIDLPCRLGRHTATLRSTTRRQ